MNSPRISKVGRSEASDEGFAMGLVVAVSLIMFLMLSAMLLPLTADVKSGIRLRQVTGDRQLAESVFNQLFSDSAKQSDLTTAFKMIGRVDPGKSVDLAGPLFGWAKFDPATSSFRECKISSDTCFYYSPQRTAGSPFVNVEVTTRSGCAADYTNCVFRRFQQQWRRRSFVDYAVFTDLETLQPELYGTTPGLTTSLLNVASNVTMTSAMATLQCGTKSGGPYAPGSDLYRRQTGPTDFGNYGLFPGRDATNGALLESGPFSAENVRRSENCFEIAYTGGATGDEIYGPIHTNDYWFWYCGNPQFNDTVEAQGDPNFVGAPLDVNRFFRRTTLNGCTGGAPAFAGSGTVKKGDYLKLPDQLDPTVYAKLASITLTPAVGLTVKVVMNINGTTMSVDDGSPPPAKVFSLPYRGVVYLKGASNTLDIQGTGGDVTFVSDGNIVLSGDIIERNGSSAVSMGFVAAGSTTIKQNNAPAGGPRNITGSFLSLTGGMAVDGWNDPLSLGQPHGVLNLKGSVIARYRPVFGSYDQDGKLQTGMRKNITYPKINGVNASPTPPYFLQPVNAVWVRLDFTETPIQTVAAGTDPGLTPKPAGSLTAINATTIAPAACPIDWPTAAPPSTEVSVGSPEGYVPRCLISP